jgi:dGTPase
LAEKLKREHPNDLLQHAIDPEVTESAALAHDLGHPPFGHVAETRLNKWLVEDGVLDGFEGNAQSFRILTKLAQREDDLDDKHNVGGLNLTRATLSASLKYPYLQSDNPHTLRAKWGAYHSEADDLNFAQEREGMCLVGRSLEAQIMDWADDIAYSVHDTEDFYRGGLIPLHRLRADQKGNTAEIDRFLKGVFTRGRILRLNPTYNESELRRVFYHLSFFFQRVQESYGGTRSQRQLLRGLTSFLIGRYVTGTRLKDEPQDPRDSLDIDEGLRKEVAILKELLWHYVIDNPSLAAQHHGHRRVIDTLYVIYRDAVLDPNPREWTILPTFFREEMEQLHREFGQAKPKSACLRIVSDAIAGMTDHQALRMHQRLTGNLPGTMHDPIFL